MNLASVKPAMYKAPPKSQSYLKKQAKDYCGAASIHGLSYIAESGRPLYENWLWVVLCIVSTILCVLLCQPIWSKWRASPTYTTVGSTSYPVWNIDFPSFTICSNQKVIRKTLDRILNNTGADNFTQKGVSNLLLRYVKFVENPDSFETFDMDDTTLANAYKQQLVGILQQSMHSCSDMLLYCEWQGSARNCKDLFKTSKTDNGFCCSFNIVSPKQQFDLSGAVSHSDDQSYFEYDYLEESIILNSTEQRNSSEIQEPPARQKRHSSDTPSSRAKRETPKETHVNQPIKVKKTNSASTLLGLAVVLRPDLSSQEGEKDISVHDFDGYKVLVHNPYEFPEVTGKGLALTRGKVAYIGVSASYIQSTDAVRRMSIPRRACIQAQGDLDNLEISPGIKMKVFKDYTRANCLLECRAHLIQKKCGCLPYFYPNFESVWNKSTTCDVPGLQCLAKSVVELNALDINDDEKAKQLSLLNGAKCNCPIECENAIYNSELSQVEVKPDPPILSRFYEDEFRKLGDDPPTEENQRLNDKIETWSQESPQYTVAYVYFKELGVLKYTRDELYSTIDVIASFGGLVGLRLGFSFLSGAEFLYWFTIRVATDKGRKRRSGPR